jgi:hypothetical protein
MRAARVARVPDTVQTITDWQEAFERSSGIADSRFRDRTGSFLTPLRLLHRDL